ncbi:hypothetical protein F52700_6224 [Fusarium sp. NRRL 52700]|nr:hypothetical protein F52700_6224 [Fusarium sp. NRRL 52700]
MATSLATRKKVSAKNQCAHQVLHSRNPTTFPQLQSSASSCRLCCLYRDIALDLVRGHYPDISEALARDEAEEVEKLEELVMRRDHDSFAIQVSDHDVILDVFVDTNADTFELSGYRLGGKHHVGQYTNSRTSFKHAKKWISGCLKTHTCPRPGTSKVLLPKRLLVVEGAPNDPVRLIETRGDEYPYVCLSHRWGDPTHKQLKTTTRTLESHMKEIEWESLPATFKDAVTVCRGFFSRDPVDEYSKDVITDNGSVGSVYIRKPINHYQDDIPNLETRGWTLQEFLLPPRVLHFGAFDITWRCKARIACECGHLDRRKSHQAPWHRYRFIEEAARPPPDSRYGALEWWEQIVHEYTSRQLTNAADKLPALSGLAQQRKQVRGGVYLAGLWKDSLIHDLCWYHVSDYNVATSGGVGHRPQHYRAPSWSWAAVDTDSGCSWWWMGAIGLHSIMLGDEPEQACDIVQVSCEPATSDSTGEVRNGFLDIKTSLASATICRDPRGEVLWTIHELDPSLTLEFFKPDCVLEDDDLSLGDRIFCAAIAGIEYFSGVECACLALKQIDGDIYQRVGFCIISAGDADIEYHTEDTMLSELEGLAWRGTDRVQIRIL